MIGEAVLIACITAGASIVCQVIISHRSCGIMAYRIDQLEEKVQKHNNYIERLYRVEDRAKSNSHRLDDLEHRQR